jgi:hypothetical protein
MHSDNTYTDKKLRELEKLSFPDLSRINEHWQQMRTALQPGAVPSKSKTPAIRRLFRLVVAALVIGGLSLAVYKYTQRNEAKEQQASGTINGSTVVKVAGKDSPVIKFAPVEKTGIHEKHTLKPASVPLKTDIPRDIVVQGTRQQTPAQPLILKATTTVKKDTAIILNAATPAQPSALLDKFFKQLEKGAQEFVINNRTDTIINGREGSSLLIPAYAFGNRDNVVITLKEFYSYADIISNKLTTTSGNEQLETGGMIHLGASVNGKEVNISPGKKIRWFIPDTTSNMEGMQLFTATSSISSQAWRVFDSRDTVSFISGNAINWQQQNQGFQNNLITTSVKVLDLRDLPYKITTTKGKYTGFFAINKESVLSKEELIAALHKKYKYYDKIVIRKGAKTKTWGSLITSGQVVTYYSLGDSTWLPLREATMYKLPSSDTLITGNTLDTENNSIPIKEFRKLASRYSVDIFSLGWINCDRFYNDNRSKIDYIVNLGDNASNYYTVLVFDRIKSMMPGYATGNKVVFSNVPNGESVKIVSIGIRGDKTVSAMAPVELSKSTFTGLRFEETTPAAFKNEARAFDK